MKGVSIYIQECELELAPREYVTGIIKSIDSEGRYMSLMVATGLGNISVLSTILTDAESWEVYQLELVDKAVELVETPVGYKFERFIV